MNAACQHAHKQDHFNQHSHEKFCFRMISQEYLFIRAFFNLQNFHNLDAIIEWAI